jgi:catechol 2,3-dioxygenase-like lactoylglutathione lyase family enzyme
MRMELEANGSGVALFPNSDGGPIPADDPMRHIGFRTSRRGLEAARAELDARGIGYHEGDYGVAWSVYLPDPDGYQVEITTYEPASA